MQKGDYSIANASWTAGRSEERASEGRKEKKGWWTRMRRWRCVGIKVDSLSVDVVWLCGHTFERSAIVWYIESVKHAECPNPGYTLDARIGCR